MPHAVIEYSDNLQKTVKSKEISKLIHQTLIESGLFSTKDIKTRAYAADDFHVGEEGAEGEFLHTRVYILEGRTIEQRKVLSFSLFSALRDALPKVNQLSVDIRELAKEIYRKNI